MEKITVNGRKCMGKVDNLTENSNSEVFMNYKVFTDRI